MKDATYDLTWQYELPKDLFQDLFENPNPKHLAYTLDMSRVDAEEQSPDIMQLTPGYVTPDWSCPHITVSITPLI